MVDCDEYLVVVTGEFRSGPREPKFPATGSGWMQKFRKVRARAQMSQKNGNALEEILYIYIYTVYIYILLYYIILYSILFYYIILYYIIIII